MKCPTCKTQFEEKLSGIWPFCCKRCKMLDLGRWAKEDYRIPGPVEDPESILLNSEDDPSSSNGG